MLEAIAADCPVIESRIPTVREIADDAALFAEFSSPDEFAAAMSLLLIDEALQRPGDARVPARVAVLLGALRR